ncbi:MAG: hypothetical protein PHZ09_00720 [Eubacteriales bacterium]|jgi:hypothetical protein|nr:hypothetical protein [Eubacteriales bacterium]
MTEVKPIQSKEQQEYYCGICGIEYNADALAYAASEDGAFLGMTQFAIRGKAGIIYNIALRPGIDDTESLFIMGRAAMNFIDLCGISDIYFEDDDKKLGGRLGFRHNSEGRLYVNSVGLFTAPCKSCEKSDG